ncbi:hypothetical protein OH687_23880 [Burkholderia anthina]|nr:hypothetical protein OH687_23880 [Burkholderia anthina]
MRPIVAKHGDFPLFVAFLRPSDCPLPTRRVWCWPSAYDPSPDTRPSPRAAAARAVPAAHRLRDAARSAPRVHEERGVIHKVLILFALCIAGLAAIAAGFQHIPS